MLRSKQTNEFAKKELIAQINTIAKMWDLNKRDLAFISGIKYKTIQRCWHDVVHMSVPTLEGLLMSIKVFIPDNLDKFSDLTITDEMMEIIK